MGDRHELNVMDSIFNNAENIPVRPLLQPRGIMLELRSQMKDPYCGLKRLLTRHYV